LAPPGYFIRPLLAWQMYYYNITTFIIRNKST
jgi:hypothetical protein